MKKETSMKCIQCGKKLTKSEETKELWPFCSKRCKMIDLGKWLGEKYVLQEDASESEIIKHKNGDGNDDE